MADRSVPTPVRLPGRPPRVRAPAITMESRVRRQFTQLKYAFKVRHHRLLSDLARLVSRNGKQREKLREIILMLHVLSTNLIPPNGIQLLEKYDQLLLSIDKSKLAKLLDPRDLLDQYCWTLHETVRANVNKPLFAHRVQNIVGRPLSILRPATEYQCRPTKVKSISNLNQLIVERELTSLDSKRFTVENSLDQPFCLPIELCVRIAHTELPPFPPAFIVVSAHYPAVDAQLILHQLAWTGTELFTEARRVTLANLAQLKCPTIESILNCWYRSIRQVAAN